MDYIFQNKRRRQGIVSSTGRGVAIIDNRPHICVQKKQIQAIQRVKLKAGCLNVAGEIHSNYKKQPSLRNREAQYAEESGLKYYEEAEYSYPAGLFGQTMKYGDDYILKLVQTIEVADVNIDAMFDSMPQDIANAKTYYNEFIDRMMTSKFIIIRMKDSDYKGYRMILESLKSTGLYSGDVYSYNNDLENNYKTIKDKAKKNIDLFRSVFDKFGIDSNIDKLTFMRSMEMHASAQQTKKVNVLWKVGDTHIDQIKAIHPQADYNILSRSEFYDDFVKWNNGKGYSQL